MDERLQIIFSRRSIRAYTGEPVSEADITSLLEAGMAAPSAMNRQPWHLVAVTDKQALQALADAISRGGILPDAGLAIVVCGDPSVSAFWLSDCGAASENILVAAAGLGLGGLWMGCQGRADRAPRMGETILGNSFVLGPGGKGSNQAVAVARLGADVHFISKLGDDAFADLAMATWAEAGVKPDVMRDPAVRAAYVGKERQHAAA